MHWLLLEIIIMWAKECTFTLLCIWSLTRILYCTTGTSLLHKICMHTSAKHWSLNVYIVAVSLAKHKYYYGKSCHRGGFYLLYRGRFSRDPIPTVYAISSKFIKVPMYTTMANPQKLNIKAFKDWVSLCKNYPHTFPTRLYGYMKLLYSCKL